VEDNRFMYGLGVNPVHPDLAETSDIVERNNQYLAPVRALNPRAKTDDGTGFS